MVEALIATGAPESCEALARRLLEGHPMWGAEAWWFDVDERSWICDGVHSPGGRRWVTTCRNSSGPR
ncbi:hypothetical protein [Streptomyces sp. NRRL S-448]|uniref:hypothetical protein n=1 Tax=Streptomyces sp. NRRL S-448 TaxID=1463907 RepID=UPI000B1495CC